MMGFITYGVAGFVGVVCYYLLFRPTPRRNAINRALLARRGATLTLIVLWHIVT